MLLDTDPSIQIVGEAEDCQDAVRKAKRLQPDVILMDLVIPQGGGIEAIEKIKRDSPNFKIIVLTTFGDEPRVKAAMEAGADGYLLKDADGPIHPYVAHHLVRNLTKREEMNASGYLTEREKEILRLVSQGMSNKAIAQDLSLSVGTVKVHVSHILDKLDVSNRTEASMRALQMGLITQAED